MKKILFFTFILASFQAVSQNSFEMGFSGGITNYFGDLGNEQLVQTTSTRPGAAITLRNFLKMNALNGMANPSFGIEARLSWHRIGYDESLPIRGVQGFNLRNYGRGLNFRNDIFGLSTHVTYTLYENRRIPLHMQHAALFFFTGVGIYYSNPVGDLFHGSASADHKYFFWADGTIRDADEASGYGNVIQKDGDYETILRDWHTEGQGAYTESGAKKKSYSQWQVGFPVGIGMRHGISKVLTVSFELGYYMFLTDYLDDVSDQYVTKEELNQIFPGDKPKQELAEYISDPTDFGSNGYPGPQTSVRGNPAERDSYTFTTLEIAYKFEFRPFKTGRFLGLK